MVVAEQADNNSYDTPLHRGMPCNRQRLFYQSVRHHTQETSQQSFHVELHSS